MFKRVRNRGGYKSATLAQKWRTIYNSLGLRSISHCGYVLKDIYKKYAHLRELSSSPLLSTIVRVRVSLLIYCLHCICLASRHLLDFENFFRHLGSQMDLFMGAGPVGTRSGASAAKSHSAGGSGSGAAAGAGAAEAGASSSSRSSRSRASIHAGSPASASSASASVATPSHAALSVSVAGGAESAASSPQHSPPTPADQQSSASGLSLLAGSPLAQGSHSSLLSCLSSIRFDLPLFTIWNFVQRRTITLMGATRNICTFRNDKLF